VKTGAVISVAYSWLVQDQIKILQEISLARKQNM
jgi:hypothetical protein